jgi:hypothetical protein
MRMQRCIWACCVLPFRLLAICFFQLHNVAHVSKSTHKHCTPQVEEDYQRQMGITAAQQRTDAYMRTHTLTHQAILNPTSRVPVYPSDAVLVKPVGFGLGRASPEAVPKVAAKHGPGAVDLQDCPLLPRQYRWVGLIVCCRCGLHTSTA